MNPLLMEYPSYFQVFSNTVDNLKNFQDYKKVPEPPKVVEPVIQREESYEAAGINPKTGKQRKIFTSVKISGS